jgi:hypothetical protein
MECFSFIALNLIDQHETLTVNLYKRYSKSQPKALQFSLPGKRLCVTDVYAGFLLQISKSHRTSLQELLIYQRRIRRFLEFGPLDCDQAHLCFTSTLPTCHMGFGGTMTTPMKKSGELSLSGTFVLERSKRYSDS